MPHKCLAGCGKNITYRFAICRECEQIYGNRSIYWPTWLRYSWAETQRERRSTRQYEISTIPIEYVTGVYDGATEE
jgi:hypothetical protein